MKKIIPAKDKSTFITDLSKSFNWYDFSIKVTGYDKFEERFAGHMETGAISKTDPLMGGVV